MTDNLKALAEYFTGSAVAQHSIGLQLGGPNKDPAVQFFAVRRALGIEGYVSAEHAAASIEKALSLPTVSVEARNAVIDTDDGRVASPPGSSSLRSPEPAAPSRPLRGGDPSRGEFPLRPCPFCGAEASMFKARGDGPPYIPCCTKCAASLSLEWIEEEAARAWNSRAAPEHLRVLTLENELRIAACHFEDWARNGGSTSAASAFAKRCRRVLRDSDRSPEGIETPAKTGGSTEGESAGLTEGKASPNV